MLSTILLIFLLLFSLLVLVVGVSAVVGLLLTWTPFVSTYDDDINFIVKELKLTSADNFYDLGSGHGKIIFLVEKLSGARVKGFELIFWAHWLAKLKKLITRSKAVLVNRNFFKQDWSEATVVYGYLYPPHMGRVEEKFKQDCKPGTLAVIRDFPFPNLIPSEVYSRPKGHKIYLYKL